ncbi:MAG: hypothetical protein Q4G68_00320 [Planctomycetia bacterium]|nr:hypothetical protein [Planctomycetia bacterium]
MKKIFFCLLALVLTTSAVLAEETLRMGSYNVEYSENATAEEIGEMLKAYNLDIVGFNEAPDGDWTARVGKAMGLDNVYVGTVSSANHVNKYKTILSRYPLTNCHEFELDAAGGWNPASAVGAEIQVGTHSISFYSTHICFNGNQDDHAKLLVDSIMKADKTDLIIVVGDFNCKVDHTSGIKHFFDVGFKNMWLELGIDTTDLYTWNALNPEENLGVIDQIVVKGNAEFTDGNMIELERPLSDHKPIWCEIKF